MEIVNIEQNLDNFNKQQYKKDLITEFTNKTYQDYNAIGFDADHCILRYNLPQLTKLCYTTFVQHILEMSEFKKLKQLATHIDQKDFMMQDYDNLIGLGLNYSLLDIEQGTLIKINNQKQVQIAYQGIKQLSSDQIIKIYGQNKKIEYSVETAKTYTRYRVINGFYDTFFSLLYAKVYEYFQLIKYNITPKQIYNDFVNKAIQTTYNHYDKETDTVHSIKNFGQFYPEAIKNVHKIVIKQEKMKNILKKIKAEGKFLFLVTNSHFEFLNINMKYAYGEDWQQLFDKIIVFGCKPNYFLNQDNQTFYYDENQKNKKSIQSIQNINELQENKILVGGHYTFMQNVIKQKLNISQNELKICYMGDNYLGDCYYTEQIAHWDSYFICEEILEEQICQKNQSQNIFEYQSKWNSYFYEIFQNKNIDEIDYSFWYSHIKNSIKGGIIGQVDSKYMLKNFWLQN